MKQKQRLVLPGIAAVALIFAACGGDSGNNGSGTEGDSSSSAEGSSSSVQLSASSSSSDLSSSTAGFSSSSFALSSSSVKVLSSSSTGSSSSSLTDLCTNTYGTNTVKDCRDSRTYKTVVIGTQTWMAENLNYADSSALSDLKGDSWCYGNSADSCAKYGHLYTWASVMGVTSTYNSEILGDSVNHRGICPYGWHVPRSSEWSSLENYAGDSNSVGTYLKAKSGWYSDAYHDGNGTDAYGFSALPGGYSTGSGNFERVGLNGHWWTATESKATIAYYRNMDYGSTGVSADYYFKDEGRSLRCLKDSK